MLERNLKLLNEKKELRKYYLAQRKVLSQTAFQERNDKIFFHFSRFYTKYQFKLIHTFLGSHELLEVDTDFIIRFLWAKNVTIVVPKIISYFNTDDTDELKTAKSFISRKQNIILKQDRMEHYHYQENDVLERNKYKILESSPSAKKYEDLNKIQMILCPLLTYDELGNRLGYGKGYYDEFLNKCNPKALKVGLSLFPPHKEFFETEAHDIRLSHCINPQGVIKF